jgi:hypothetical protein
LAAVGGRSFLRAHGRNLCLGALAFLWLTGPFLVFATRVPTEIFARAQELNIFAAMRSQNDPGLLWRKTAATLLSPFFPSVSTDTRFGLPDTAQMDPFAAIFAGFGILAALVRPRSRFTWFILPGLAVGFAANIFAHWVILPHFINSLRFFLVVPFLYLAAARGFQVLAPVASGKGLVRYLTVAFLSAGLFGAALSNANVYHFGFRNSPRCWDVMGFPSFETERYVHLYAPHRRIMMDWEVLSSHARFLLLDLPQTPDNWEDAKPFPLDQPGEKGIAAFVLARKWPQRLKELEQSGVRARTTLVKDPWGGLVMGIIDVPPKKGRK